MGRSSEAKDRKYPKKYLKCDGRTDRRTEICKSLIFFQNRIQLYLCIINPRENAQHYSPLIITELGASALRTIVLRMSMMTSESARRTIGAKVGTKGGGRGGNIAGDEEEEEEESSNPRSRLRTSSSALVCSDKEGLF